MIAFWSTLSLNMPDFTRFGGGQRKQVRGQILGLPTTMSFIAIVAILTTSGGAACSYGEAIWDPAQLAARFSSPVVVVVALVALVLATDLGEPRGQRREPVLRLLQRLPEEDHASRSAG